MTDERFFKPQIINGMMANQDGVHRDLPAAGRQGLLTEAEKEGSDGFPEGPVGAGSTLN
jgi:hypothetical protein